MKHIWNIVILVIGVYIARHVDGWTIALIICAVFFLAHVSDELYQKNKKILEEFNERISALDDEETDLNDF